jgi:hypothetical protein
VWPSTDLIKLRCTQKRTCSPIEIPKHGYVVFLFQWELLVINQQAKRMVRLASAATAAPGAETASASRFQLA